MIVWVNGAFGSGKTTLVGELRRRMPQALVFDPEQIGYVLRDIVEPPTGNFQDLPLWRRQVISFARGLVEAYDRPVLAPMTLVEPAYAQEIHGALRARLVPVHHFYLRVSPEVLTRRINLRSHHSSAERDRAVKEWCVAQIPRCLATEPLLPPDTVFLDGERPLRELADEVLSHLGVVGCIT